MRMAGWRWGRRMGAGGRGWVEGLKGGGGIKVVITVITQGNGRNVHETTSRMVDNLSCEGKDLLPRW